MNLSGTVELMNSDDYQDRFRAEYRQLVIRAGNLENMLLSQLAGTLDFTPSCSIELLDTQLTLMKAYMNVLLERARVEGIDLRR